MTPQAAIASLRAEFPETAFSIFEQHHADAWTSNLDYRCQIVAAFRDAQQPCVSHTGNELAGCMAKLAETLREKAHEQPSV